jgi:hypothetical protein
MSTYFLAAAVSAEKVDTELEAATRQKEEYPGGRWRGQTYEEGVINALEWVTGQVEESPILDQ